ncbi:MAG TPA: metallophosphoesterase, partial [Pricia sp.]|nr:metallophosphoesterase [Pricia sp.]
MTKQNLFAGLSFLLVFSGCATYKAKYAEDAIKANRPNEKEVAHTFYLIGDAGKSPMGGMKNALKLFKRKLDSADVNSTALFLGDNIYPAGMPDPVDSTEAYFRAKNDIDAQLKTLENFEGQPLFIPGNHDWYTEGLIGLKREQDYIQEALDRDDVFFPENGCPLRTIEVNDDIAIIALDTEWYLTDWNERPDINKKCEIKSRERFWLELEDAIKDNRQRTTLIAMHHPMFTYGQHGGQFTLWQNFYQKGNIGPLPILGTLINLLRKTTGASREDLQNRRYIEMKKRLITLAQYSENVILASGHEHTLQYIVEDNTPQIVSGAGSKIDGTRLLNGSQFSTGRHGYAILEIYTDGSSQVDFYAVDEAQDNGENQGSGKGKDNERDTVTDPNTGIGEDFMFTTQVLPPDRGARLADRQVLRDQFPKTFPPTVEARIYSEEEIARSGFFKWLWGDRYREYYATPVTAPTVNLDTLMGGLRPIHKGGGHQSKSLRLRAKNGSEYVMR